MVDDYLDKGFGSSSGPLKDVESGSISGRGTSSTRRSNVLGYRGVASISMSPGPMGLYTSFSRSGSPLQSQDVTPCSGLTFGNVSGTVGHPVFNVASSSLDAVTSVSAEFLHGYGSTEGHVSSSDTFGLKGISSTKFNPPGSGTTRPNLGILDSFSGDDVCMSGAQSAYVDLLDFRITDYFTNTRCFCSFISYSVHFTDFGIRRVSNRRFSDFCRYDTLLREFGYIPPISLPEKRYWDKSPSFLSQRFQGLCAYFRQQLTRGSRFQLYMLQLFLGCGSESVLYIHLVTCGNPTERMNALSLLFRYLMRSSSGRAKFLSSIMKYPLDSFIDLSVSVRLDGDADECSLDYRLYHPLVVDSMLDCLVSGDGRTVYEVCGIFLRMLHIEDCTCPSVYSLKAISYVTKAVSRLIGNTGLGAISVSVTSLDDPIFLGILDGISSSTDLGWHVVSYYLIMSVNLDTSCVVSFLEDDSLNRFIRLLGYNDRYVIRRFSLWVLWLGLFDDKIRSVVSHDTLDRLLRALYGSTDKTCKLLCGLVLSVLISRGWYEGSELPRAAISVSNLIPHLHGIDQFIERQIFSHASLKSLCTLFSDSSLPGCVRVFLASLLEYHVIVGRESVPESISTSHLCDTDFHGNTAELSHAILGPIDPDCRLDITVDDSSLMTKFGLLYLRQLGDISTLFSECLYGILECYSSDDSCEWSWSLYHSSAVCLLFLPYSVSTVVSSDYFNVDFDPWSMAFHYRNTVSLGNGSERLTLDGINPIHLEEPVVLRFDRQFFLRRILVLRAMVSFMQAQVREFEELHLSRNELPHECMELLRQCWCGRDSGTPLSEDVRVEKEIHEGVDPFNNFTFDGFNYSMLDLPAFHRVDAFELRGYANDLIAYGHAQRGLVNVLKTCILYHQLCSGRITKFKDMISCLESRVESIQLGDLVELDDLEERYLGECSALSLGLQEENSLLSTLQEKHGVASRLQSMLRSSRVKLDACHRDIAATQQRLDELPRLRSENLATQTKLNLTAERLSESIKSANERILELQDNVALEEREKQEFSLCIQRLSYLSSILDDGKYRDVTDALDSIPLADVSATLHRAFGTLLAESTSSELLDSETVLQMKTLVMQQLTSVQERLNAVYSRDSNLQIAALNREVTAKEDALYQAQLDLNTARKNSVIDGSVLEDTLGTQKVLMESLEGTISNLMRELRQVNATNSELDTRLASVKERNNAARARLESTKADLKESITNQRGVRERMFLQVIAAEFLCKKVWQEHRKMSHLLSFKDDILATLSSRKDAECLARDSVVTMLRNAAERMSQTADFLGNAARN
ncbi:hypothetical protein BBOV_III001460 [Babesia bovis T2Bo]|uniref:PX domain-containing protein n=1 Tax=Babesia bovis TaxID=5865 RepID=A7AMC9_BABBO|nr:hypothetical protein BBOV_III001460 [Babesia bovis T2Bo]EDO07713.1 hypothetical protein BBOV_III001460 [Babesia bovis T2Bo]|eukprot:XP_001611281.1 hypothetical protein [Babesia bovis T2Bo]